MNRALPTPSSRRPRRGRTVGRLRQLLWLVPALLLLAAGAGRVHTAQAATSVIIQASSTSGSTGIPLTFQGFPLGQSIACGTSFFSWSFGDGTVGTNAAAQQHAYTTSGQFQVGLSYTDCAGTVIAAPLLVTINGSNTGTGCNGTGTGFTVTVLASPSSGAVGTSVTLTAIANGVTASAVSWTYGDGQTSGFTTQTSIAHVYSAAGTFTVTASVTASTGLSGCGTTTVVIGGGTNTGTGNVVVAANGPYSGCINQPIAFNGQAISVNNGAVINTSNGYTWNFGDNTSGVGQHVSHTYTTAGNFTVTLSASDSVGQSGSATTTAIIGSSCNGTTGGNTTVGTGTATQNGVTANTGGPYTGSAGSSISFSATASTTNAGASIISYVWSFGDNSSATGQQTTHTYSGNGTYTVALTVTDSTGAVVTAATTLSIAGGNRSVSLVSGCNNIASTFPDNTPTGTITNAVSPGAVLLSVWRLTDPLAVKYKGYFPGASQASDLPTVNRLDAIFVCVSGPATLSEPSL